LVEKDEYQSDENKPIGYESQRHLTLLIELLVYMMVLSYDDR